MGSCLTIFLALLLIGALVVTAGCIRCGGPFALAVYVIDAVLSDH